jgi:hypothetical protein
MSVGARAIRRAHRQRAQESIPSCRSASSVATCAKGAGSWPAPLVHEDGSFNYGSTSGLILATQSPLLMSLT